MAISADYTDPTILAFLRTSGMAQEVAAADVARRQAAIRQALGQNLEELEAQGDVGRRNIAGSQEARGMFRSGQTLTRTAEQEAAQARQAGQLQGQAASQIGDLQGGLLNQIAQNQARASELGLQQSQAAELKSGQAAIDARYGDDAYNTDELEDTYGG